MTKPVVLNLTWDELGIVVLGVKCFLEATSEAAIEDLDDSERTLQGIDEIDTLLHRLRAELDRMPDDGAAALAPDPPSGEGLAGGGGGGGGGA